MIGDLVHRLRGTAVPLDAVYAGLLFMFVVVSGAGLVSGNALASALLSLGFCVPLVWRRTAPDAAALALVPAHLAQLVLIPGPHPGNVTVPIMIYAVAAYGRARWTKGWLVAGLVASLLAGARWAVGFGEIVPFRWLFAAVFLAGGCAAAVAAAWYMGSLRRSKLAEVEALRGRAEAVEREHAQAVQLAATEERQRLAREMHDIVAHSLSIIVVQADGAHYVASESPGDAAARLAQTTKAIETIQSTARAALAETRRLVGVLHAAGDAAELAPAASLRDIEALVRNVTDAGWPATLSVVGDPAAHAPLGATGELTAYRIVQESLTNVMKHAGPGARAWVTLAHSPAGLTVTVADDGRGLAGSDGQGHGLIGMRERVGALGGTLSTRNRIGGGFEVVAVLPADPEPSPSLRRPR